MLNDPRINFDLQEHTIINRLYVYVLAKSPSNDVPFFTCNFASYSIELKCISTNYNILDRMAVPSFYRNVIHFVTRERSTVYRSSNESHFFQSYVSGSTLFLFAIYPSL